MTDLKIEQDGLPMRLRRVRVRRDGSMSAAHDRSVQHFKFLWRGETFVARYRQDAHSARLRFASDVAVLPYAADNRKTYANLKCIVESARDHLGPVARITRERRVHIGARVTLDAAVNADRLMAILARELLRLDPYLRLIQTYRAA